MIASVVATLCDDAKRMSKTINQISSSPQIEIGEYTQNCRRIPATIEAASGDGVESTTRWLQGIPGVAFVDVVYVHFEDTTMHSG